MTLYRSKRLICFHAWHVWLLLKYINILAFCLLNGYGCVFMGLIYSGMPDCIPTETLNCNWFHNSKLKTFNHMAVLPCLIPSITVCHLCYHSFNATLDSRKGSHNCHAINSECSCFWMSLRFFHYVINSPYFGRGFKESKCKCSIDYLILTSQIPKALTNEGCSTGRIGLKKWSRD